MELDLEAISIEMNALSLLLYDSSSSVVFVAEFEDAV